MINCYYEVKVWDEISAPKSNWGEGTGCSLNIMFYSKISRKFANSHSGAIGCTKNYKPIGVTVHSRCVESFKGLLHSDIGEGGVAVNCEKNTISPKHPVYQAIF